MDPILSYVRDSIIATGKVLADLEAPIADAEILFSNAEESDADYPAKKQCLTDIWSKIKDAMAVINESTGLPTDNATYEEVVRSKQCSACN